MISRELTLERWQKAQIRDSRKAEAEHLAQVALLYKQNFYDPVEKDTGVPWYVVACLDRREEDCNHNAVLANGDSLWRPTVHVPRGIGPFKSWHEGAVFSLKYDHMTPAKGEGEHWDIVTALIAMEAYNGLGYYYRGLPSPYVWAGTSIQVPGKYVGDGAWDAHAMDMQPGCAEILLALKQNHGVDLNEA